MTDKIPDHFELIHSLALQERGERRLNNLGGKGLRADVSLEGLHEAIASDRSRGMWGGKLGGQWVSRFGGLESDITSGWKK